MRHDEMGGPAFPEHPNGHQNGMTLWDYYAAAALTGLCSHVFHYSQDERDDGETYLTKTAKQAVDDMVVVSGRIADAMLAERRKRMGGGDGLDAA